MDDGILRGLRLRKLSKETDEDAIAGCCGGGLAEVIGVYWWEWTPYGKRTGGPRVGFSVYWEDYRKKNRHSLMFTEADLEYFELVSASADRPTVERIRPAKS
jgi:hypothetical protein